MYNSEENDIQIGIMQRPACEGSTLGKSFGEQATRTKHMDVIDCCHADERVPFCMAKSRLALAPVAGVRRNVSYRCTYIQESAISDQINHYCSLHAAISQMQRHAMCL